MSAQQEKQELNKTDIIALRGPEFGEVFNTFLGFDIKLLVTIKDLIIHPVRVARDAVGGSKDTYLGQVRLFLFLFGLTTIFLAMAKLNDAMTVEALFGGREEILINYATEIAKKGATITEVNSAILGWTNLLITPLNLLFAVIFSLFFKMLAPKINYLGHLLLYITANNASTVIGMPITIMVANFGLPILLTSLFPLTIQFAYLAIYVWVFMRKTVTGGIAKLFMLALVFIVTTVLVGLFMQLILHFLAQAQFGASPLEFIMLEAVENAQAAPDALPSPQPLETP